MSALERAEAYVSALDNGHQETLLQLAALRQRFTETLAERDAAVSTLEAKKRQYASSLQSVKLVSARMIQEREAFILTLNGGGANQ
jgi:hypothetical protein